MEKDTEITKVIFRKFMNGDIIAMFPEIPGSSPFYCISYMHIGQHCTADPWWITDDTTPARPEEYADLKVELESIGYNLKVVKRFTYKMQQEREAAYHAIK